MNDLSERNRKSMLAVNLGLWTNIFLAGVKTFIGIIGHSPALLAEGVNSTSDVAYYIVAIIFVRLANKPADNEHPYGHQQLENIASLVVGSFIVTTAVAIFWDAIEKIWNLVSGATVSEGASILALWIAMLTVVIKISLFFYTRKIGKDTKNPVVEAMAFDHGNDLFSALAASIGIFVGQRGYPWVDPLAGAIVSILILRTGIHILRESSFELMNAVPSKELVSRISELLIGVDGVDQLHEVHAHRFGPNGVINVTIGINGALTVEEGDKIASLVEHLLCENMQGIRKVHVHYHPSDADHQGKTIDEILKESLNNITT